MLYETLVTLIREIDSGHWDKDDVRRFADRMLNHQADYHKARNYVNRCKNIAPGFAIAVMAMADLKEENNEV